MTEPESECYRVPTDYGDSGSEDDAYDQSQDSLKAGMKRKRTTQEEEKIRKWEEQMEDWPKYF